MPRTNRKQRFYRTLNKISFKDIKIGTIVYSGANMPGTIIKTYLKDSEPMIKIKWEHATVNLVHKETQYIYMERYEDEQRI